MFTGLVEAVGRVQSRTPKGPGTRMRLEAPGALSLGESISVSGACLTVAAVHPDGFDADISQETCDKTTLGDLKVGDPVNLERALSLGDRLGGHLVTGHVDGIARVRRVTPAGESSRVEIEAPAALLGFVAAKGSVALDGVSLTVNAVSGSGFEVMLIPHTLAVTTLEGLASGRRLNLEVDLVARYVVRWLSGGRDLAEAAEPGGLEAALKKSGRL